MSHSEWNLGGRAALLASALSIAAAAAQEGLAEHEVDLAHSPDRPGVSAPTPLRHARTERRSQTVLHYAQDLEVA